MDYYFILDVPVNATDRQIKRSYRQLAIRYHPDQNPEDTRANERLSLINEASEMLLNVKNREAYDAQRSRNLRDRSLNLAWRNTKSERQFYVPSALDNTFELASNVGDPRFRISVNCTGGQLEFSRAPKNIGNCYAIIGSISGNSFIVISSIDSDEKARVKVFGPTSHEVAEKIICLKLCYKPPSNAERIAAEAAAELERKAQAEAAARAAAQHAQEATVRRNAEASRQRAAAEAAAKAKAQRQAQALAAAQQRVEEERRRVEAAAVAKVATMRREKAYRQRKLAVLSVLLIGALTYMSTRGGGEL